MYECESCGNIYEIRHIKKGEDYNDFGYRYCPFCAAMYDIFIIPKGPTHPSEGPPSTITPTREKIRIRQND